MRDNRSMDDFQKQVGGIVRSTRSMLLPVWGNIASKSKGGGPVDVVTALDLEVEQYLSTKLAELDPSISFAGEEFGGSREEKRFWLCDPIDGTAHFVRGMPFCTVMLALIEDQQVTRSFIYDFVNDVLYHAKRGEGAYKDEERIRVSDRPFNDSYISWESRGKDGDTGWLYVELKKKGIALKTVSAGFEFAMVASGKLDGRIQHHPYGKDYDFAPGSLLVREAGGIVANLGKDTYDYRDLNFIAANPVLYKELTEGEEALFPKEA